jgi:hypothetical protein
MLFTVASVIVAAVAVGYPLYALWVVARLVRFARSFARECAARGLGLRWSLTRLGLVTPFLLELVIEREQRRFRLSTSRRSHLPFTDVHVEPLRLCEELASRISINPNDDLDRGMGSYYLERGEAELLPLGLESLDATYRICQEIRWPKKNTPAAIALVRATFASPAVQDRMRAYGGWFAIDHQELTARPGTRSAAFLDGLEQVALLADALDAATLDTRAGVYR